MEICNEKIFLTECNVKIEESNECDTNIQYDMKCELELNGLCRGCLCTDNLLDMLKTNYHLGKAENYSDMLFYCFSIKLNEVEIEPNFNLRLICLKCVVKLREAVEFKSQLETAQKTFKCLLDSKVISKEEKDCSDTNDSDNFDFDSGKNSMLDVDNSISRALSPTFKPAKTTLRLKKLKTKTKRKHKTVHDYRVKESSGKSSRSDGDVLEGCSKSCDQLPNEIHKIKTEVMMKMSPVNLPYKLEKTDLHCKICNEVFPLHKSLKIHISVHYPNHVCDICGRVFAMELQLYSHAKTHKPATLMCSLCPDIRFKSASSLKAHTRKKHLGDRNLYRCVDCDVRFCSYNARRRHLVEVHGDNNRKYICKNCPKRYGLKTHLDSHIRNVHLQVRNYVCDTCGDAFFTKIILKNHMAKHTGEKNHQCSLCDKRYARKHTLTEHMKIHNNVKSHVCAVCGRAFTQKSTLKYHMRVHKENVGGDVKAASYEIQNEAEIKNDC